jgi:two-component system alkaline phosphatase synthesis response regulator PhoP
MAIRILVVDDNEMHQNLVSMHLSLAGHDVKSVVDGKEAIGLLDREAFDVVLLDIDMPFVNGKDVLRHIRDCAIKVRPLMTTGADDWQSWNECTQLGALDYLPKPFDVEDLLESIEKAMSDSP